MLYKFFHIKLEQLFYIIFSISIYFFKNEKEKWVENIIYLF